MAEKEGFELESLVKLHYFRSRKALKTLHFSKKKKIINNGENLLNGKKYGKSFA